MTRSYRWGPLTGVGFVVLIVVAFIVGGSSPNTDDPDSTIAQYLAKDSEFNRNIWALFIALLAFMLLVVFYNVVRSRLSEDVRFTNHATLASVAGTVSAVFLFIAIAGFAAPVIAAHDAKPAILAPNFFRMAQDYSYMFWIGAGGFGALAVWATSAVALRGAVLPRWFGWVGIVCGILALGALFFFPMFAYALWILIASILLTMRTPDVVVATPVTTTPVA